MRILDYQPRNLRESNSFKAIPGSQTKPPTPPAQVNPQTIAPQALPAAIPQSSVSNSPSLQTMPSVPGSPALRSPHTLQTGPTSHNTQKESLQTLQKLKRTQAKAVNPAPTEANTNLTLKESGFQLVQQIGPPLLRQFGPPIVKRFGMPIAKRLGPPLARRVGLPILRRIGLPLAKRAGLFILKRFIP